MSNVEERTRAFYDWEQIGRGIRSFPYRVPVAPVFEPYRRPASNRTAPVDDARQPTILSRFVDWMQSNSTHKIDTHLSTDEPVLEYLPFERAGELAEWDILTRENSKIDQTRLPHWLQSISGSRGHVAFEVIGSHGRVNVRLVAEQANGRRLTEQTTTLFENLTLRSARIPLGEMWVALEPEIVGVIEFGLEHEFMLPLASRDHHVSFLSSLIAAFGHLGANDLAVFQVLFEPVSSQWNAQALHAVFTSDGKPFFADAPELTRLAEEKCAQPLFAAVIRACVATQTRDVASDVLYDVATAARMAGSQSGNELAPLFTDSVESVLEDMLTRTTHRPGAILSVSDLVQLVDLPSDAVSSPRLIRHNARAKAAPTSSRAHQFVLGTNSCDDDEYSVGVSTEERLKHTYVIGASGTGKSTLLLQMALQDLRMGHGFAVLDPHGDLVDEILKRVPEERMADVIIVDPSDEEYPVGFNILSAHSELERILLSSDLVAVFRRLSTSFGDQMEVVLANAILVFLERPEGGTLLDLRRFLINKEFRDECLKTVRDREVISYWKREFPLLKGTPHAPILTRLNTFLRPRLIRNMVGQKADRLDMRSIMDNRKVVLAKLSQGLIGESNAHLLGSLIVSQLAQAAASRQNEKAERRVPFFLYIDEFHHFMTPSIGSILSGARKYGLGLTLAHQELRQIKSRSDDIMSAVLGNAFTRCVFRVGEDDARTLATGFSFFESTDLLNLGTGEAICRIERATHDFNLRTDPVRPVSVERAEARATAVLARSRELYGTPRALLLVSEDVMISDPMPERAAEPPRNAPTRQQQRVPAPATPPRKTEDVPSMPGRGGPQHKYLQSLIKRIAEERGFRATLEKQILDGHGHIDVALEGNGTSIGCEISVTTSLSHELGNLSKCLAGGFEFAVLLSPDKRLLDKAAQEFKKEMKGETLDRVRFLPPDAFASFLDEISAAQRHSTDTVRGYKVRVEYAPKTAEEAEARTKALTEVISKSLRRVRKPKQ